MSAASNTPILYHYLKSELTCKTRPPCVQNLHLTPIFPALPFAKFSMVIWRISLSRINSEKKFYCCRKLCCNSILGLHFSSLGFVQILLRIRRKIIFLRQKGTAIEDAEGVRFVSHCLTPLGNLGAEDSDVCWQSLLDAVSCALKLPRQEKMFLLVHLNKHWAGRKDTLLILLYCNIRRKSQCCFWTLWVWWQNIDMQTYRE